MRQLNVVQLALLLFPALAAALETQDSILRKGTAVPRATCGSSIACSAIAAITTCDCRFDPSRNRVIARTTLRLLGTIYYFQGPFASIAQRPRDATVVDRASAIRHEYAYHINPAVDSVTGLLVSLERTSFPTIAECVVAGNELANTVLALFQQALAATQMRERAGGHAP